MGKPNFLPVSRSCQDDINRANDMRTEHDITMDSMSRYVQVEMICPTSGDKMKMTGGSSIKYLEEMGWNKWSETKPTPIVQGRKKIINLTALNVLQRMSLEPEVAAEAEIETGIIEEPVIPSHGIGYRQS